MIQKHPLLSAALMLSVLIPCNAFCMQGEPDYCRSELHQAAWENDLQTARTLLEKNDTPDPLDGDKNTPLHLAINGGHEDMVKLLLFYRANPDAQNVDGNTPLHSAARWDRYEIAKDLLAINASIEISNIVGERPIDTALSVQSDNVATLLQGAQHSEARKIPTPIPSPCSMHPNIALMLAQAAQQEALATQS